jgi:head-tail adaptor
MDAGKLNLYVLFEKRAKQGDDYGGHSNKWEEVGRAFIELSPLGAFEQDKYMQQRMKVSHWVRMRNCSFAVTNDLRIRILQSSASPAPEALPSDRTFGIEGVFDPDERGWQYKLLCTEAKQQN